MHPIGHARAWLLAMLATAAVTTIGAHPQGAGAAGVHDATFPAVGESKEINILTGESVTLRWIDAGPDALIVGIGPVPAQGERLVRPPNDITYTLISGDGPATGFRSLDVFVRGRKGRGVGNPDFPPLTQYRTTVDGVVAGIAYPALVQRVYRYLQDTCGHEVESTHKPWEQDYTLWTNYAQPTATGLPKCVDQPSGLDAAKRAASTAYFVRLIPAEKTESATTVEIGAVARFRYANEERWRSLEEPAHVKAFAEGLRRSLEAFK